jgi:hypothetical protein
VGPYVVLIIIVIETLSGKVFTRQACRYDRFRDFITILRSLSVFGFCHIHGLWCSTCVTSPDLHECGASAMCRPLPLKLGLWDKAMRAVVSSWILAHQALPIFAL